MNIRSVTAACEHCGHRSEVALSQVLDHGEFTSAKCGQVSRYDRSKLDATAEKINRKAEKVNQKIEKVKRKLGAD